jgi:antitoxin CptB
MEPATTHGELGKLRWDCRRGLLELDLILEKFNARHLATLDAAHIARFRELLALPDNDLLDLVMERGPVADRRFEPLLQLLRTP